MSPKPGNPAALSPGTHNLKQSPGRSVWKFRDWRGARQQQGLRCPPCRRKGAARKTLLDSFGVDVVAVVTQSHPHRKSPVCYEQSERCYCLPDKLATVASAFLALCQVFSWGDEDRGGKVHDEESQASGSWRAGAANSPSPELQNRLDCLFALLDAPAASRALNS